MRHDNCPSCENDISDTVTSAIVSRLEAEAEERESDGVSCPHCNAELRLTVDIDTRLSLQQG
jgi:hypothetical protein